MVLLLGAGLLLRTFINIQRVEPGFEARGVLTMRLTLPRERYPGESGNAFFDALIERLSALPQVRSVAAASQFPPMAVFDTQFAVERPSAASEAGMPTAVVTVATPGYFDALRVPVRSGRTFAATDSLTAPPVAIVNQSFVDRYLGAESAIGRRIALGSPDRRGPWTEIVGVVADHYNAGATRPKRPEIYTPVRQQTDWNQLFVLVSGEAMPRRCCPVRAAVRALDPEQPIYNVAHWRPPSRRRRSSSESRRCCWRYSPVSPCCWRRWASSECFRTASRPDAGDRRPHRGCAEPSDVRWLVLRQVLVLTGTGLAIGAVVLAFTARLLEGLLFGVQPADPLTIALVAAVFGTVALAAVWVPARRATRVDPIRALRAD